jgi:hypothetical protein
VAAIAYPISLEKYIIQNYFVTIYAKLNRTLKQYVSIEINFEGIIDFSSYNSDNKLRQWKLKRTEQIAASQKLIFKTVYLNKLEWFMHKPQLKRTGPKRPVYPQNFQNNR